MTVADERLAHLTPLQRAAFALKETQARLDQIQERERTPIAIVGMACRLPGGATDPMTFWQMLCRGDDAIREIPADRWDVDRFYDPDPRAPGKMNTRWGGFLDGIAEFDNLFFGISDREAERMDPQHRLLLELAWEALEDAGAAPVRLRGSPTGVFLGISHSEYGIMLCSDPGQADAHTAVGTAHCIAANRISFTFDLHGASVALDAACSSSLVAVHWACQNLRRGESEVALAGGASAILSPMGNVNLTKEGFSAPDGRIRAFDARASGCVRGEGAGVVVLKPLPAALRDRDSVYAVIRGSAVNHNGFGGGLTVPSRRAQEAVLRQACAAAGIAPADVQYVETHGTGTRMGDAIEAAALGAVVGQGRAPGRDCAIGSVKTNIGHLEAAAGVAGLMKVALALRHRQLPASLHFDTPSPDIPFADLRLRVQDRLEPWPDAAPGRLAGVSAFGFGGNNAHVVLEEAPPEAPRAAGSVADGPRLLTLSARTDSALRALAVRYLGFLRGDPPPWNDICHTAATRREHHDCRLAVLGLSHQQAADLLGCAVRNEQHPGLHRGRKPYGRNARIAFMYDGRVEHWRAIGRSVAHFVLAGSGVAADADAALRNLTGRNLLTAVNDDSTWTDDAHAVPAAMTLQLALTGWWHAVGICPDAALGRGWGECTAACVAGSVSAEEALRAAVSWGRSGPALGRLPRRRGSIPCFPAWDGPDGAGADSSQWPDSADALCAAVRGLRENRIDVCLEVGPASLTAAIHAEPRGREESVSAVPCFGANEDGPGGLLVALAALYAAGLNPAWGRTAWFDGRFVRVPTYPWQRRRLWVAHSNWLPAPRAVEPTGDPASTGNEDDHGLAARPPGPVPAIRMRPDMNAPYVAPRTALEEAIERSWRDVLRLNRVGMNDDFFELGGDSLQATILLNALRRQLGEDVDAALLFQVHTVGDIAAVLRRSYPDAVRRFFPAEKVTDDVDTADGSREVRETPTLPGSPSPGSGGEPSSTLRSIPRLNRVTEDDALLERLDEMSDDEVERLLRSKSPQNGGAHGA